MGVIPPLEPGLLLQEEGGREVIGAIVRAATEAWADSEIFGGGRGRFFAIL